MPLLTQPHMAPLEALRREIAGDGRAVPHADPRDGGASARLLVLLETPGPGAEPLRFVSRDNPTGTAANLRHFLAEANIARADSLIWNVAPWVVHAPAARNRPLRRGEVREGLALLPALLDWLPRLAAALLMGRIAAEAAPVIARVRPGLPVVRVPHPSPTIVCTSPAVAARISAGAAQAAALLQAAACTSSATGQST